MEPKGSFLVSQEPATGPCCIRPYNFHLDEIFVHYVVTFNFMTFLQIQVSTIFETYCGM
jgi:hypothetical protein